MKWYALFVETGREHLVQQSLSVVLHHIEHRCIVPSRRLPERRGGRTYSILKPLFPGYVLVKLNLDYATYRELRNTHRVFGVLKMATDHGEYWSHIPEEEIAPILQLIGDGEIVEHSRALIQNAKVMIVSGPLLGMEGTIRKIDKRKHRARIALAWMGVQHLIDVGLEVITAHPDEAPVSSRHSAD